MPACETYRQALLERFGGGGVYVTTNTGSTTELACSSALLSSSLPTSHLALGWVYVPTVSGTKQRRVTKTGTNGTLATLTVDGAFGSAVGNGVSFEYSRHLPLVDQGAKTPGISLTQCLSLALPDLEWPDEIAVAPAAGAYTVSLATYAPWLNRPSRLLEVLDPPLASGYPRQSADWRRPRLVVDGTSARLDVDSPWLSTDAITLRVMRPCDTLISGVEQPTGSGFTSDAATALPEVNELVTVALIYANRARSQLADNDEQRTFWLARAEDARGEAMKLERYRPRSTTTAAAAEAA